MTAPADAHYDWYAMIGKLRTLDIGLAKPVPGDWLYSHPEEGQSFQAYSRSNPVRPDGEQNTIYLLPLGKFAEADAQVLELTREYMTLFFGLETVLQPVQPLTLIPDSARRFEQVRTDYILYKVPKRRMPTEAITYMAVISADLYPGEGWNYVFGQASLRERVGVSSIHRLKPGFYKKDEDQHRFLSRLMKTMTHEAGHMLSINHCIAAECVMNGSNSIDESDARPVYSCAECSAKICWGVNYNPKTRLLRLEEFFRRNSFYKDAEFCRQSVAMLAGK